MSGSSGSVIPARILEGTVISADRKNFRVNVAYSAFPGKVDDVRVTSLYCHPNNGEGGHVLPDPGATCYVAFPSEANGRPFLLSYVMPPTSKEGDLGSRAEQNTGDIVFNTRDGNTVTLRKGGLVQIAATPLCQTLYVPVGNIIRSVFAQKEDISLLGKMEWVHGTPGTLGTPVTYRLEVKDTVEDKLPKVTVEVSSDKLDLMPMGYVNLEGDFPDPFLSLQSQVRMRVMDTSGELPLFEVQVGLDGALHVHSTGYTLLRSDGVFRISALLGFDVVGVGWNSRISTTGNRTEELLSNQSTYLASCTVNAPAITLQGAVVRIGSAAAVHPVSRGEVVEAWAAGVNASLAAAGHPTAPLAGSTSPVLVS